MDVDLGRIGIWSLAFTHGDRGAAREAAAELEELGCGTLWLGGNPGGNPRGDLVAAAELLAATNHTVVAPACVSIWHQHSRALAAAYDALPAHMRNRLLLGLGVGHPKTGQYHLRPYTSLRDYLDELDGLPAIPRPARILCAHGPRLTGLAATRATGVQPHLTTVGHTALTRELLGDGPLLAPSVSVVLETSPGTARAVARTALAPYLAQANRGS
ncbi:LLM class F420-dependent oxidoreductase [Streptomyces sp. NPDC093109]|uniref:LLM class F420-dependent oxidoreductase n=1 Tax=Streptomyces sp. NPDC093109 TaxID=3154977 RepID=UPI00344DFF5A